MSEKVPVEYNANYLRFRMPNVNMQEFVQYVKNVISNSHVMMVKTHVLVLNDIEALSHQQQHTILKLFERNTNVRLVLTSTQQSGLVDSILSHFAIIRTPRLDSKALEKSFHTYCEAHSIEDHENTFQNCDQDIQIALKALCFPPELLENNPVFDPVERELSNLLDAVRKTVLCSKVIALTRQSIYKIMKYNIENPIICRKIMDIILQKHKKKPTLLHFMTKVVAQAEHQLLASSKPIFYYEHIVLTYAKAFGAC